MTFATRILLPLVLTMVAASAAAAEVELSQKITSQDGWAAYQVPMIEGSGSPCCYEWHSKNATRIDCDLDGRSWTVGNDDRQRLQNTDDLLDVYLHSTHGKIDRVRGLAASCEIRSAGQVRWLGAVDGRASIALLSQTAARATTEELADSGIAALAMHADPSATPALVQMADSSHPRKLREQSLFWLGQLRGAEGAQIVERVATTDGDADLRANAVFDLSQAHGIDAYMSIHRIAQSDASDHVREQALFWMAQMGDARARTDITAAIGKEPSHRVREQAVFALSQLKDDQADAALIALVRGDYPREVKQQALFWLGQSGSDTALKFLDEILERQPARSAQG